MEIHYSLKRKDFNIPFHGEFEHKGGLTKRQIKPELGKAINEKWGFAYDEIESIECYYYSNGIEVQVND